MTSSRTVNYARYAKRRVNLGGIRWFLVYNSREFGSVHGRLWPTKCFRKDVLLHRMVGDVREPLASTARYTGPTGSFSCDSVVIWGIAYELDVVVV